MGACASKPNVLKEEGIDAPVTREVDHDAGDTTAEDVVEVAPVNEATAAADGDGDGGENSRQSLEFLLKKAEAKEAAASTGQTKTEHLKAAASAENKAPVTVETKEPQQTPAEKVAQPADKAEEHVAEKKPAATCEKVEQPVDKFTVETKTTAAAMKEASTVSEMESKKPVSTATAEIVRS